MQDEAKEKFEFEPSKIKRVKISEVRENDWNPKNPDAPEYKKVKRSIELNGLTQPIFVRQNDNGDSKYEVLDGAHRYRACYELGFDEIYIYDEGEVSDELAKSFTIFHQVQVPFDESLLAPIVVELNQLDFELPYTEAEIAKMTKFELPPAVIVEDEVPEMDNEPAKSELGKIYKLGEHRLLCGDSTDATNVAILMDGMKADIAFTSPPYNAGLTPSELEMKKTAKYANDEDNKTQDEYREFLDKYIAACMENAEYVFMNVQSLSGNKKALINVMYDNQDIFADTIIWDKQHTQPAMGGNVLNSRFEYVHCFSKEGKRRIGTVDFRGTIDNVLSLPPQRKNEFAKEHNATFSIEFAAWFVKNFAKSTVLDSFGGTGTTLIACEQLGKKCYMIELDPKYCDIVRRRYWKFVHDGDEEGWEEGTPEIGEVEGAAEL